MTNSRLLTTDALLEAIAAGEIDTVVVAFTDMQGRLQGKRLHAEFFRDHVLADGTEGCNYLLAVDVEMNTVPGYAISSWESGYGDMIFDLDLSTIRRLVHLPGTAMIQCDLRFMDGTPVAQSRGPCCAPRSSGPRRWATRRSPEPNWSSSCSTTPTNPRSTRATPGSPPPTSTTWTTRSSAPPASSHCA